MANIKVTIRKADTAVHSVTRGVDYRTDPFPRTHDGASNEQGSSRVVLQSNRSCSKGALIDRSIAGLLREQNRRY